MIERVIVLSLITTGIFIAFSDGMILAPPRRLVANFLDKTLGKRNSLYVQKPLFGCLSCMASIWTIVLTLSFDLKLILAVCGLNMLISRLIEREDRLDVPTLNRR